MTVLPAIVRELRAQSRQPPTYWLRVLGAGVALGVAAVLAMAGSRNSSIEGGTLFGNLNATLFFSIWLMAPLLAADCISSERREGTLGLLFLTPLRARDIVLAKGFVHGLRAMTLWLAVLPIMAVPVLQGGVGWREITLSVLINFSALCMALACGLVASAYSKTWLRAQAAAFLLAAGVGACYVLIVGKLVLEYLQGALSNSMMSGAPTFAFPYLSPWNGMNQADASVLVGLFTLTDFNGIWADGLGWMGATNAGAWLRIELWVALGSFCGLFLAIELAARRVLRVWQEEPPSARQQWIQEKLTTPVIGVDFLKKWMRRKLAKNPIGWLEQRSWSGRLVTWSWFAIMVSLYSALLTRTFGFRSLHNLQQAMAWVLLVGLASSAAQSFQRERETGVMELLLVSPMTVGQIIGGRLRGIWGQFLPALGLLLLAWLYFWNVIPGQQDWEWLQFFLGAFLVVPVVGLYQSLRRRTFISALLSTIFVGLLLPFILQGMLQFGLQLAFNVDDYVRRGYLPNNGGGHPVQMVDALWRLATSVSLVTVFQLIIGLRTWRRLQRDMERRNFAFTRMTRR